STSATNTRLFGRANISAAAVGGKVCGPGGLNRHGSADQWSSCTSVLSDEMISASTAVAFRITIAMSRLPFEGRTLSREPHDTAGSQEEKPGEGVASLARPGPSCGRSGVAGLVLDLAADAGGVELLRQRGPHRIERDAGGGEQPPRVRRAAGDAEAAEGGDV